MNVLTILARTINPRTMSSPALILAALLFAPTSAETQQLQRGVSVKLALTNSGTAVPDADNADAWIVTVTGDNNLYFGIDPETPERLFDAMKTRPRIRDQELYIKADARASFAAVKRVLEVAHADRFEKVVLLTEQSSTEKPPTGLTLWLSSSATPGGIIVHIDPGQGSPLLTVDREVVPLNALERELKQFLQGRREAVALKAGHVPFAEVAHVVDVCNMSGAKPVFVMPEL